MTPMKVLVAYATRHGATQGIAERIAETIRAAGLDVALEPAGTAKDVAAYDAFVIGSAAYMFHWLKEAMEFVRHNRATLAGKPVWLFSSGPLGAEPLDEQGRDQKVAAIPKEIEELKAAVGARDHRVFFGAYSKDQKPIGLAERFVSIMPAAREALPEGDFRDWPEIEAWATSIAADLKPVLLMPSRISGPNVR
jgi:menaquinone-dependent protoporphyrinogen oxidase